MSIEKILNEESRKITIEGVEYNIKPIGFKNLNALKYISFISEIQGSNVLKVISENITNVENFIIEASGIKKEVLEKIDLVKTVEIIELLIEANRESFKLIAEKLQKI